MRVAHIITRMIIGGAQENTLFNCLDLMREYDDKVRLFTGPSEGPEGRLLEEGRAGGLEVEIVPHLRRAIHPWQDLAAYHELKRGLADFRPDVVHTHSAKGGMLGRAAAWSLRVPVIVHTVHGAPFHPHQPWYAREFFIRCERWGAQHCHHMISVADAMTELMVAARVASRDRFTTIYSGMDVEPLLQSASHRESVRRDWGFTDDHVVFGKIARLFALKGHEYLLAAAESVVRREPRARFLLVGDGLLRGELETEIEKRALTPYFRFTGLVPPESIPRFLSAMDVLVHCSLREGLARALPQALIAGKPVVSYDVDGAREVCIDHETGILLPPKAVEPLADALCFLAGRPDLRQAWGREGRRRFTDRFRHQTMTAQIRSLYQALISRKSG